MAILRGLAPMPWPADYKSAATAVAEKENKKSITSLWLSHGLDEGGIETLTQATQSGGRLEFVSPVAEKLPLLLRPAKALNRPADPKNPQAPIRIDIDGPKNIPKTMPVSVHAQGKNGQILDIQSATLSPEKLPSTISFDIMDSLQGDLSQFRIAERKGAGAVFLLDDQSRKRDIGIVGAAEKSESETLMEDSFYIARALEPYANIKHGNITDLIAQKLPIIVLPDIAAMPAETLNALETWVKEGGLLLRFSGPNMAESTADQFLLPVPLRSGGRSLSGAMTWEKPQKIAPFPETSPLYGLDIPPEMTVTQQILADPAQDLSGKIWAQLEDGTPLITAAPLEKGLIVLIHTSAGPEWSDLSLSGLYVNVLRRITALSGTNLKTQAPVGNAVLEPVLMMDGFGALVPPAPNIMPLPAKDAEKTIPSAQHPPGLYAHGGLQFALNLGTSLPRLKAADNLPAGITQRHYESTYEVDLMPFFLGLALSLFFLDWAVMIILSGTLARLSFSTKARTAAVILLMILPWPANAADEDDILYAGGLYLAYMKTGDTELDALSQEGLEKLALVLKQRTSVEPDGVIGLDPENDTLGFFPLIYWPITPAQNPPSDVALKNIQLYLDHGGTILFDTRDQNRATNAMVSSPGTQALRAVTGSINIPPLSPIADDHVLGRSFYLMKKFPGRFENGTLWIAQEGTSGRDGVSPVIVGSNDWASAWASFSERTNRYDPTMRDTQPEMAMRFGVNIVMYALTGNYKADQVHIPFILERLGK